jgi:hypothetical protein
MVATPRANNHMMSRTKNQTAESGAMLSTQFSLNTRNKNQFNMTSGMDGFDQANLDATFETNMFD